MRNFFAGFFVGLLALVVVTAIIMLVFPNVYVAFLGGLTAFFGTLFGKNLLK